MNVTSIDLGQLVLAGSSTSQKALEHCGYVAGAFQSLADVIVSLFWVVLIALIGMLLLYWSSVRKKQ